MAQVFKQSHPVLGVDSRTNNWQNTRYTTVDRASEQSSNSEASAQTSSAGVQGMPSSIVNPAPAVPPRVQRRRGCQHCITCSGIQHHCHSTALRSSDSPAAEWWPGGIHSPIVYYHLRAKQLRYAQKFPQHAGIPWRGPRDVNTRQSSLLNRRKQGPLAVLVPAVYTNVNPNDSAVQYLGDRVVQLTSKPAMFTPAARPSVAIASASVAPAAAATKRGMDTPMCPAPRATWSHSAEYTENAAFVSRRSSGSTITTCGMALDPKRRCTEQGTSSHTTPLYNTLNSTSNGSFLPAGHFIARTSPPASNASPPRVYPGIVLQHNNNNSSMCQQMQEQQHQQLFHGFMNTNGNAGSTLTPATLLGVITPPLASMAPLSAGSDSSCTSIAPMSTGSADLAMAAASAMQWSAPMPTHAAAVWELTSASAQPGQVDSITVPVLSMVNNHTNSIQQYNSYNRAAYDGTVQHVDQYDPTMQQYYSRQYNIKQEQAFPCHQVVEIGPETISAIGGYTSFGSGESNNGGHASDTEEEGKGGWAVGLLKSLAGSIKRSVSP